jgi:hypothetical protein
MTTYFITYRTLTGIVTDEVTAPMITFQFNSVLFIDYTGELLAAYKPADILAIEAD